MTGQWPPEHHRWAHIAWAGRPHPCHYVYAAVFAGALYVATDAPLLVSATAGVVALIALPWADILLTWLLHVRRSA